MDPTITLLLVEDEPLIALAVQTALEDGGYAVISTPGGREAIAILDQRMDEIAGLITDIRLAEGPDGWEIARHARELRADLPVVYVSGDSAGDWAAHGVPESMIIQKPFASAQIIAAISNLLVRTDSKL